MIHCLTGLGRRRGRLDDRGGDRQPDSGWAGIWIGLIGFALSFVALLVGQFFAGIALAAGMQAGRRTPLTEAEVEALLADGDLISLTFVVSVPLTLIMLWLLIRFRRGRPVATYLALRPVGLRQVAAWVGAMLIVLIGYEAMTWSLDRQLVPQWAIDAYTTADLLPVFIVMIALVGPVCEEVVYRGYVLTAFMSSRLGKVAGVLLTAGLWAGIHFQYDVYDVGWIFLFGLMLGTARLRTGSLATPIVLHILWNSMAAAQVVWYLA